MTKRALAGDEATSGGLPAPWGLGTAVPGQCLAALAVRVNLRKTEWRVLAIVLSSPSPVSALSIATRLRLDYGLVKRVVRELEAWRIIERTPEGLRFQPDHTRWGPPSPPAT